MDATELIPIPQPPESPTLIQTHPLDETFNDYLEAKGYRISQAFSLLSIQEQPEINRYEAFLAAIGINSLSNGFRNAARTIEELAKDQLTELKKSHYIEVFYSLWPQLQADASEPDITQLEELVSSISEPALPYHLKQQIESLFSDGRDTEPYHNVVKKLLNIDPEKGAELFFSIQGLPEQNLTEITNRAEQLLADTKIPNQQKRLIARLLAACTHTISDKNYSHESQVAYAQALVDTLSFIQSEGTLEITSIDSKFTQGIINESKIDPNDSISTRILKVDALFDKAVQGDESTARIIGIHPSIYSYVMKSRMANERINNDYPGVPLDGGLECIRNNQVVEVKHTNGSTHLIVISGDATSSSKESWKLTVFTNMGLALSPDEIDQLYSLHVVSEHNRSYSQLNTKVPLTGARELPVQLFRTIFGLEQSQIRSRSKKIFPYYYPQISKPELEEIVTSLETKN